MGRPALNEGRVHLREATPTDTPALFATFRDSVEDLLTRLGHPAGGSEGDEPERARAWAEKYAGLFEHLAGTAESSWLAERDGEVIGYARAIRRGGLRELTEFFVRPGAQARGTGAELLARAFPAAGAQQRLILATLDPRALTRYLRTGLAVQDVVLAFARAPRVDVLPHAPGLEFERLPAGSLDDELLVALSTVDEAVLGHRRDVDLRWLAGDRPGFLARRDGTVVGYGFVGAHASGPVAALDAGDVAALLAHAERLGHALGLEAVEFSVPARNRTAVAHFLAAGFRLDAFQIYLLSDHPFAGLDRYVISGPTFFL